MVFLLQVVVLSWGNCGELVLYLVCSLLGVVSQVATLIIACDRAFGWYDVSTAEDKI